MNPKACIGTRFKEYSGTVVKIAPRYTRLFVVGPGSQELTKYYLMFNLDKEDRSK